MASLGPKVKLCGIIWVWCLLNQSPLIPLCFRFCTIVKTLHVVTYSVNTTFMCRRSSAAVTPVKYESGSRTELIGYFCKIRNFLKWRDQRMEVSDPTTSIVLFVNSGRSSVAFMCLSCWSVIIGSDNGLPSLWQATIWTNDDLMLDGHLGTNYSKIWIKIKRFSATKMFLKIPLQNCSHFVSIWSCLFMDESDDTRKIGYWWKI